MVNAAPPRPGLIPARDILEREDTPELPRSRVERRRAHQDSRRFSTRAIRRVGALLAPELPELRVENERLRAENAKLKMSTWTGGSESDDDELDAMTELRADAQARQESAQAVFNVLAASFALNGDAVVVGIGATAALAASFFSHIGGEYTSNSRRIRAAVARKAAASLVKGSLPSLVAFGVGAALTNAFWGMAISSAVSLFNLSRLGRRFARTEAIAEGRVLDKAELNKNIRLQMGVGFAGMAASLGVGYAASAALTMTAPAWVAFGLVSSAIVGGGKLVARRISASRRAKSSLGAGGVAGPTVAKAVLPAPHGAAAGLIGETQIGAFAEPAAPTVRYHMRGLAAATLAWVADKARVAQHAAERDMGIPVDTHTNVLPVSRSPLDSERQPVTAGAIPNAGPMTPNSSPLPNSGEQFVRDSGPAR